MPIYIQGVEQSSGGAPTDADYLVGTTQGGLSAEIVVGAAPGGELGGTWAAPTVDGTHSGTAHHAVYAHPNHSGEVTSVADGAQTVAATHSGSAHHAAAHTHSGDSLGALVQADFTTAAAPAAPGAALGRFYVVTGDRPGFRSGAAGAAELLATLETAQTFLTGVKTFNSSILAIRNPADTFSYTIAGAAILADRVLTLPLVAGADTFAVLGLAQTWTALQSFGTNLGGTLQTAAQTNVTSLGTLTGLTLSGALVFSGNVFQNTVANSMYFSVDTDNDNANAAFYWQQNGASGAGTDLLASVLSGTTNTLSIGANASILGAVRVFGSTSGYVTIKPAAVAGAWSLTLPAAVGSAGQQLTDAAGNGITSWAAASLGAWKNDLGILDPHEALTAVVKAPTHKFTYNKDMLPEGQSDGGGFQFTGIFAEEAPWAMYGERDGYRSGIAFSNVNAFGYARAAIEALHSDLQDALAEIASLKIQVTALQGA